jgi:hypothetical protein
MALVMMPRPMVARLRWSSCTRSQHQAGRDGTQTVARGPAHQWRRSNTLAINA